MKKPVIGACIVLIAACANADPSGEIASLAAKIEKPLRLARYMEGKCEAFDIAGWEGLPTQRCRYEVTDSLDGSVKTGLVVMLNPTALKLSEWVINACTKVLPNRPLSVCAKHVVNRIVSQSGGQFPVEGIVYEDLIPEDGVNEAYGFRDGVTTVLDGVKHRRTTRFSTQELEATLSAQPLHTASEAAFARIAGVTRQEFRSANPGATVEGLDWLSTVRGEYQKAWNGSNNTLIEAWLAANPP